MTEPGAKGAQFKLALAALSHPPSATPVATFADALLRADALHLYAALSQLRGAQVRAVLHELLILPPSAASTTASVRTAVALATGDTSHFLRAAHDLKSRHEKVWEPRAKALLALMGRKRVRDVCEWGEEIAAVGEGRGGEEGRVVVACVLGEGREVQREIVMPVRTWANEVMGDGECEVGIWQEFAWAEFAGRCIRGQADGAFTAREGGMVPAHGDRLLASGSSAVSADDFVELQGVVLRRRMSLPDSAAVMNSQAAEDVDAMEEGHRFGEGAARPFSEEEDFVMTEHVRETLRSMAMGLADGQPVLLQGPPGCGKSALVSHVARRLAPKAGERRRQRRGEDDSVVRVQMDSVLGASGEDEFVSLVGGVVPLPGGAGFRWRPGPIGTALLRGALLIFENLGSGQGAAGVVSLVAELSRLRPGDSFDAPGRGLPIVAQPGFAVVATRTTVSERGTDGDGSSAEDWEPPGMWPMWRLVRMPSLPEGDLEIILQTRFPAISDCVPRVLASVDGVRAWICKPIGKPLPGSRSPNMRDAVKLCKRLEQARADSILSSETAAMETADVLVNWEADPKSLSSLRAKIALAWSLSASTVADLSSSVCPSFSVTSNSSLHVGRARLDGSSSASKTVQKRARTGKLALTGHTLRLLERISRSVQMDESVLLSGESGCGKTACVQELARRLGKHLVVVNMSRNSDIGDLLGGFRPVDTAASVLELARLFEVVFCRSVSRDRNERFLAALRAATRNPKHHSRALKLIRGAIKALPKSGTADSQWDRVLSELFRLERTTSSPESNCDVIGEKGAVLSGSEYEQRACKRRKTDSSPGATGDEGKQIKVGEAEKEVAKEDGENAKSASKMDFEFAEGVLIHAMRNGDWILLDEINLAPTEVLERLVGLMDERGITLANAKGEVVSCSGGFCLFAAMNPPTDAGKKQLPLALRSRFTEFFVDDCLNLEDLSALTLKRLFGVDSEHDRGRGMEERRLSNDVAEFYIAARNLAEQGLLSDGSGKNVRYSLRSLSRMLDFASSISGLMFSDSLSFRRALFEGALLAFVTPLPREDRKVVAAVALEKFLDRASTGATRRRGTTDYVADLSADMRPPASGQCKVVAGYHVECSGSATDATRSGAKDDVSMSKRSEAHDDGFIITPTVRETLRDVCRALVVGAPRMPVLLQGPTAAGKTSLVTYLAKLTGKRLLRINNHEHTDVSEYLGGYVSTEDGSLRFEEGPVVQAARFGDWIVLDELNLAPPEVLEALNRLLDDNREVRIPETGEVVKAAKGFTIFATQNPPGLYGGRKELSRAFRGRFVEVLVDELPDLDLKEILGRRSHIPVSFAGRMISAMRDLQIRRRSSQLFSGKSGFVTARDLFRWASRRPRTREELAIEGFFLLGERSRKSEERELVREVLIKHMGVEASVLSDSTLYTLDVSRDDEEKHSFFNRLRLAANSAGIALTPCMRRMLTLLGHAALNSEPALLVGGTGTGKTTACSIVAAAMGISLATVNCHRHTEASDFVGSFRPCSRQNVASSAGSKLFDWIDGALVSAMRKGTAFLVDEINMADDAVAERLNSVLENDRTLLLSEKGGCMDDPTAVLPSVESIVAAAEFRAFATMNPGGDFGKKELSPALRNRFTEMWIPPPTLVGEYAPLVVGRIGIACLRENDDARKQKLIEASDAIISFVAWNLSLGSDGGGGKGVPPGSAKYQITLRDIAAWAEFVAEASQASSLCPLLAFAHGARLVILDGLTVGSTSASSSKYGDLLWEKVLDLVPDSVRKEAAAACFSDFSLGSSGDEVTRPALQFGQFELSVSSVDGAAKSPQTGFAFGAKSTARNCARIARAMALCRRPILLEGPPGSGKSSVVEAIASATASSLTRVNLSEHTEMADLIGGFIPCAQAGVFAFRHGPLLTAIEKGHWVLLDELNLASQSVLEGLNGILDHRCAVYVPELDREIAAVAGFRVFATQNAAHQGGGRRGLPRSFLNRFTLVNVESPCDRDIEYICAMTHPSIDLTVVSQIVGTLRAVSTSLALLPIHLVLPDADSLNLRDALRWCDLLDGVGDGDFLGGEGEPPGADSFFDAIILQRLNSQEAREQAINCFSTVFGFEPTVCEKPAVRLGSVPSKVRIGRVVLERKGWLELPSSTLIVPTHELRPLAALALGVSARWPVILSSGSGFGSDAGDASLLVRKLGILCGRRVFEIRIGGGTDSGDLLGGFTQCDASREILLAVSLALRAADGVLTELALFPSPYMKRHAGFLRSAESRCRALRLLHDSWQGRGDRSLADVCEVINLVDSLESDLQSFFSFRSFPDDDTKDDYVDLMNESKSCLRSAKSFASSSAGAFEWRKSALIAAAERGDWVLILNADRCPAAVLDRLNPLLERPALRLDSKADRDALKKHSGSLLLTEAPPNDDGSPASIEPHADFRIFMTVDSRMATVHGKGLSKALRNRSMEISMSACSAGEAQRDTLIAHGAPGDSVDLQIALSVWDGLIRDGRLSPISSEQGLSRVAILSQAIYAQSVSFSARQAFDAAWGSLFSHSFDRPLGSNPEVVDGTHTSSRSRIHPVAPSVVSLCEGGLSFLACRDIGTVANSLALSEVCLTEYTYAPLGNDQPIMHESYLGYYLLQACLASSFSVADMTFRIRNLAIETTSVKERLPTPGILLALSAARHTSRALSQIVETEKAVSARSSVCSPSDPVFGMDTCAQGILSRCVAQNVLAEMDSHSLFHHLHLVCVGPLLQEWEAAMEATGSRKPVLVRSKILFETDADGQSVYGRDDYRAVESCIFPLLKTVLECGSSLRTLLSAAEFDFEEEVKWRRFFWTAARLCKFSSLTEDLNEVHFTLFIGLLRLFLSSVPFSVRCEAKFAPLQVVCSSVESTFRKHVMWRDYNWLAKQGLPIPRSELGSRIEDSLLSLIPELSVSQLPVFYRRVIVQAFVTCSSRRSEGNVGILNALSRVPETVQNGVANSQMRGEEAACGSSEYALMSTLVESSALSRFSSSLVDWADGISSFCLSAEIRRPSLHRLAMEEMFFSQRLGLADIVPMQRLLWVSEELVHKGPDGLIDSALWDAEWKTSQREGIISYLRWHLNIGDLKRDDWTFFPLEDGSELTLASLCQHMKALRREHLWSSADAISDACCSALVLQSGAMPAPGSYHSKWSVSRGLLITSLVALVTEYAPEPAVALSSTLNAEQFCDIAFVDRVIHVLDGLSELALGSRKPFDCASNAISDALKLVRSLSADADDLRIEFVLAAFGIAWAEVGIARLNLLSARLAAGSSLDPALVASAEAKEIEVARIGASVEGKAYSALAANRIGGVASPGNGPIALSGKLFDMLSSDLADAQLVIAHRSIFKAPFSVLCDVIRRLLASCVLEAQVSNLSNLLCAVALRKSPSAVMPELEAKLSVLEPSLSVAADRLSLGGELGHLRDVGGDTVLAVREMQVGLQLSSSAAHRAVYSDDVTSDARGALVKDLLSFPRAACSGLKSPKMTLKLFERSESHSTTLVTILRMFHAHLDTLGRSGATEMITGIQVLVSHWKKELIAAEEEDEKANSLYRMQSAVEKSAQSSYGFDSAVQDDDAVEADYQATFNVVSESFKELNMAEPGEHEDLEPSVEEKTELSCGHVSPPPLRKSVNASDAWDLYQKAVDGLATEIVGSAICSGICDDAEKALLESRNDVLVDVFSSCSAMLEAEEVREKRRVYLDANADGSTSTSALASYVSFARMSGSLFHDKDTDSFAADGAYNFYAHSNTVEALQSAEKLIDLSKAAATIQVAHFQDVGNHPVLQGVIIAAERAARSSSTTPLSVLVIGLETVLRKVNEWQRHFATKEMRMESEVRAIAATAASWRKLEIRSWPELIESRAVSVRNKAHSWFYFLFDCIFAWDPYASSPSNDMLATIDQFIRASSVGEFEVRLCMVRKFGKHLAMMARLENLATPPLALFMLGLANFYTQYLPDVIASLVDARRPLQKQMREFASLAKWDKEGDLGASVTMDRRRDRELEYSRLKQAAESTRRKLHKVCREMDSSLRVPVSQVILPAQQAVGMGDMSKKAVGDVTKGDEIILGDSFFACRGEFKLLTGHALNLPQGLAGGRLGRLPNLLDRLQRVASTGFQGANLDLVTATFVASRLRLSVSERTRSLRLSPNVGVQIKAKALADLLKALKCLGISPHPSAVPENRKAPSFWLQTPDLVLEGGKLSDDLRIAFHEAAMRHGRLCEVSAGQNLNSDVSRAQAVQCVSFCSHLLDMFGQQRSSLYETSELVKAAVKIASTLGSAIASVESADGHEQVSSPREASFWFDARCRLKSCLVDMKVAAGQAREVLRCAESDFAKLAAVKGSRRPASVGETRRLYHFSRASQIAAKSLGSLSSAVSVVDEAIERLPASSASPGCTSSNGHCIVMTDALVAEASCIRSVFEAVRLELQVLHSEAHNISSASLATACLFSVLSFADQTLESGRQVKVSPPSPPAEEQVQNVTFAETASRAEAVINAVLIGTQRAFSCLERTDIGQDKASERLVSDGDFIAPDSLSRAHRSILKASDAMNLNSVCYELKRFYELVASCGSVGVAKENVQATSRAVGNFVLHFVVSLVKPMFSLEVSFHFHGLRLLCTLESLFVGLCSEGFCRPAEDDGNAGSVEENVQTHDGTGFGDIGDGDASLAQNVSEQVEDEEQLLGMEGDLEHDSKPKTPPADEKDDNETGFEMTADFDGELVDAPDQGECEDEDAEDHTEKPPPEKQMGESGEKGEDIVDERLWDKDREDSPGENEKKEASELEKGEDVKGAGLGPEADLVARDSDSDALKKEKKEPDCRKNIDGGGAEGDNTVDETLAKGDDNENLAGNEEEQADDGDMDEEKDVDDAESSGKQPKLKMDDMPDGGPSDDGGADGEDIDHKEGTPGDHPAESNSIENDGDEEEEESAGADLSCDAMGASGDGLGETGLDENAFDQAGAENQTSDIDVDLPEDMAIDEEGGSSGESEVREHDFGDELCDSLDDEAMAPEDAGSGDADAEMRDTTTRGEEAGDNVNGEAKVEKASQFVGEEKRDSAQDSSIAVAADERVDAFDRSRNCATSNPAGATTGVSGGEMDAAPPRNSKNGFDGRAGSTAATQSSQNADQRDMTAQASDVEGTNDDQRHLPGKEDVALDNALAKRQSMDPNPHREVATDFLLEQWKHRLDMLESAGLEDVNDSGSAECGDLYEFMDNAARPSGNGSGEENGNESFALGPATDEQHRSLPEGFDPIEEDEEEENNSRQGRGKDSNGKTKLSSEKSRKPPFHSGIKPPGLVGEEGDVAMVDRVGDVSGADDNPPFAEKVAEMMAAAFDKEKKPIISQLEGGQQPSIPIAEKMNAKVAVDKSDTDEPDVGMEIRNLREENLTLLRAASSLGGMDEQTSSEVWLRLESLTASNASALCEQLRLVLEPTLATGLAGDFKTGKRLNMRRVIEFVASDFRRDRIWLRRVRPDKRSYDVLIAIDDSESMADSGAGPLALEALSLLTSSLSRLEVGRVAVASFGAEARMLRDFVEPLPMDHQAGAKVLSGFTFAQKETNTKNLLEFVQERMCTPGFAAGAGDGEEVKLAFVISDGRLSEREEIGRKIRALQTARVLVVFIVVDAITTDRKSIFDVKRVEYDAERPEKMSVTPYMDKFPVAFYSVIRDVAVLPVTLGDALRQWFEIVNAS